MRRVIVALFCLSWLTVPSLQALPLSDALAMFESGATQPNRCGADRKRGNNGEVSRYQIMPAVWRQYSRTFEFEDPKAAWSVAECILTSRMQWFRDSTRRDPTSLEIYLLWNKPGHFKAVNFEVKRVNARYKERAQRFANLCAPNCMLISMVSPGGSTAGGSWLPT